MAEEHKKGLNAKLVGDDLENCCRKADVCGQCQQNGCIIGKGSCQWDGGNSGNRF